MKNRSRLLFALVCFGFPILIGRAQSPPPIIVPAASAMITPSGRASTPTATMQDSASLTAAIKTLEEMKAANEEILSKQKAAIERLDELQKAADQLKIFTRRSTG
jgi:hypothetical protein